MTDHDPSDRDELIAAYLDGEATEAERAIVENDADLLERATLLRQVADMVAEPVMAPPPEVKRAHIAMALSVSPTAPNVTSLARKRRAIDLGRLATVAAVVIAILAVPIALLSSSGGDDDDSAVASSADGSAVSTDGMFESSAELEDAGRESDLFSDDAAEESAADADNSDDGAGDGASGDDGEMAEDDGGAELAQEEPVAAESDTDDDGESAASDGALRLRVDVSDPTSSAELAARLRAAVEADEVVDLGSTDPDQLSCAPIIDELIDGEFSDAEGPFVAGIAVIDGVESEYLVGLGQPSQLAVFDAQCAPIISDIEG